MKWAKTLIEPDTSIITAMQVIDSTSLGISLVVDGEKHLLGTVTDGDIRRAILRGISLHENVSQIMNRHPITASVCQCPSEMLTIIKQKQIRHLPVIDESGRLVRLEVLSELANFGKRDNWVVLMAGGLGSRLHPLTNDCPKPMLKVGDKPILETIITNFIEYGFSKFYLAVNYKAEMIEDYFGDGAKWGIKIHYLREQSRLGTAGALSLLPEKPTQPLFIMNGDLLTKINFAQLLDFHIEHHAQATMCVREYNFQVPYGVVEIDQHRLKKVIEKPVQQFFVSAGVYLLEPEALSHIPQNTYFDMPSLFDILIENQFETTVFPVREYWLDIGRMGDFERANGEFPEVFK